MKTHFYYLKSQKVLTLNKTKPLNLCSMMCWLILVFGMSNFVKAQETGTFTDERDGREYRTVVLNRQTWMAENLSYKTRGSWTIDEKLLGHWYTYETAKNVCPTGWHLPSRSEWIEAIDGRIDYSTDPRVQSSVKGFPLIHFSNNKKMYRNKSGFDGNESYLRRLGTHLNSTGLNLVPASFYKIEDHAPQQPYENLGLGAGAVFWTSSSPNSHSTYRISFDFEYSKVRIYAKNRTDFAYSVRCVKD